MEHKTIGMSLILTAVIAMAFAQLLIKHVLTVHGEVPLKVAPFASYVWLLLGDWKAWLGGLGLVSSAILWYAALSRVPLSFAFPFAAISYPLIFVTSILFLGESFSYTKLLANGLIVSGVIIVGLSAAS